MSINLHDCAQKEFLKEFRIRCQRCLGNIHYTHISVGLAVSHTSVYPHALPFPGAGQNCDRPTKQSKYSDLSDQRFLLHVTQYLQLKATEALSALVPARRRTLIPAAIINNNKGTKNIIQTMTSVDIVRNVTKVQSLSVRDIVLLFSITLTSRNVNFLLSKR